jgi:hypothetical protein
MGLVGAMRLLCCVCVAAGLVAAPAHADTVLVLGADGGVRAQEQDLGPATEPAPPPRTRATARTTARRRSVSRALERLVERGEITPEERDARLAALALAKSAAADESGTRRRELKAVIKTIKDVAARRKLTRSRLAPLWLILERNREWWTSGAAVPAPGTRVGFEGSELVWQYYAGEGLQLQVLATFGKLNALWADGRRNRMAALVDEMLPLAAERAGGLVWEYYFAFGGGRAPWASAMAQATGLQAMARAASRLDREADVFGVLARGVAPFDRDAPSGLRDPEADHYLLYSFAPGMRVLNGFLQSLIGLHDYARIAGDPVAQALYEAGERQAEREVPRHDTGAWSLYSDGGAESTLSYHELVTDFLDGMCAREGDDVYCATRDRFTAYLTEPPVLELRTERLRRARPGKLELDLSKVSDVSVLITRDGETVLERDLGIVGHGTVRVRFDVPRRRGTYDVEIAARDLAGNAATITGQVEVIKPS